MLHTESMGKGPDLVMLHGWGMHSGLWGDWTRLLAEHFRVHLIDLPGHGLSEPLAAASLDDWSDAVLDVVPDNAWWLGWSLGGLLAMNLVHRFPERVRGLVLVASTPKFVKGNDWAQAMDADVFDQFAADLDRDVDRTLTRFLSLQVRGSQNSAVTLKYLRSQLKSRPQASAPALGAGLRLLQTGDLREAQAHIKLPLYWLFGQRDTLVPAAVAGEVTGVCRLIEGAGHAPFLSHPQLCADQLCAWLSAEVNGSGCANF